MAGSTHSGSNRLPHEHLPTRLGTGAAGAFALAGTILVVSMTGCESMQSVVTGEAFKSEPEPTVPTRKTVGTSTTPVHTVDAPQAQRRTAGRSNPSTASATASATAGSATNSTTNSTTGATTDALADGTIVRNSVNGPLAVPGDRPARAQRPSGIALPGVYAPSKASDQTAPSEGVANLAQVSFATEGGDFSPDIDRGGSFMVYASTQHHTTFDLYRKSIDGRTVTQLTNDPSDDLMPSISPDGNTVAYASNRNGNWDIFTMPIAGGAPTQITFDADEEVQPTWAPDGKRLAFSRQNGRTGAWEIWIVDTSMPGVRSFVCEGFMPRWAPVEATDKLLFQRARQRGSRLYGIWTVDIVQGEGRNPTEVLSARSAAILQPSWSPDGTRIVFTTVENPQDGVDWPERADIWAINADGTNRMGLTRDQFRNMQPVWAANGRIYFVSNRSGVENIWALVVEPAKPAAAPAEVATSRPSKSVIERVKSADPRDSAAAGSGAPDFLKADQMVGGVEE
jgi:dipeptidyl aminopeptidase/acylaminoacyl peptidase